jgi:hypothetical protein
MNKYFQIGDINASVKNLDGNVLNNHIDNLVIFEDFMSRKRYVLTRKQEEYCYEAYKNEHRQGILRCTKRYLVNEMTVRRAIAKIKKEKGEPWSEESNSRQDRRRADYVEPDEWPGISEMEKTS